MDADDASSADMGRRPDGDDDPLALDEETVERLLAGKLPPDQAPPENAAVAALLAAMTAPPSQEELAGQVAALAELRAVTMTRAAATHLAIKPRRRRRVGLAAVAVAGALATGGVAAAATGHLPEPVRKATRSILVTVGSGEPASTVPHPASSAQLPGSGRTGQPRPPTDATVPAPGTTGAAAAASPDLKGLCRAYLAGKDAENGKKLDATAFQVLARAAGGEDKVQASCQRLQPPRPKPDNTAPTDLKKDSKPNDQQPGTPEHPGQGQGNPQTTGSQSR
jgi:hypothetical protein